MATHDTVAPVIIKKKKVISGDGHHGGAWKVAYADFVTAMMAFFMLMWLLNATTEKQRKGLADYFSPTIAVSRVSGGGDGAFGGDSVMSEEVLTQNGTGASLYAPTSINMSRGTKGDTLNGDEGAEQQKLSRIKDMLIGGGGESLLQENELRHVNIMRTDRGLVFELFDTPDTQLFHSNSDAPTDRLINIVEGISIAFETVENRISIEGFVAQHPIVLKNQTPWALSSQRADQVRKILVGSHTQNQRIARITGHGDGAPKTLNGIMVENNRIEVILLREDFQ